MQVHGENFNVGVQALMLLFQISTKNQIASDRFYRALYAKLLSPAAVSSSKVLLPCSFSFSFLICIMKYS